MPESIRAAVIGAGLIAKQHLHAIASIPGVEVVGVCDLSPVTAEATADRFGLKRWHTSHAELLEQERPQVVHIVTPAATHYPIAMDCLAAGCHVLVEKPLATELAQCEGLLSEAERRGRWLIEDYNYQFNKSVQQILSNVTSGAWGRVRHVDVQISLELFAAGSRFADPDLPHPAMRERTGAVSDFLTHMAYLAHAFIGPHKSVLPIAKRLACTPSGIDFFQCLVEGEHATALLGLTTDSCIEGFSLRVNATKARAETNLFESGVVTTQWQKGPKPLMPIRSGLARSRAERRSALGSLSRKLSGGPGSYEGLWELVRQTYQSLRQGAPPPVTSRQILDVNRLCEDITNQTVAA